MDPDPLWAAGADPLDLCPTCGAYWRCEHREATPLWEAHYATDPAVPVITTAQDVQDLAAGWHDFMGKLREAAQQVTDAAARAFAQVAEKLADLADIEKDPDWPSWAHADWQGFPHRFRPMAAVITVTDALARLRWQLSRAPPRPRSPPTRAGDGKQSEERAGSSGGPGLLQSENKCAETLH